MSEKMRAWKLALGQMLFGTGSRRVSSLRPAWVTEQVQGQPAQFSRPSLKVRNKGGAMDTAHC